MSRICVLIAPYFPPSTLAGVHRARHLAKHLSTAGWKPIVLCVNEAFYEERPDPGLARLVPGTVEIIRVNAVPTAFTRSLGIGDIGLRAYWFLRRAVCQLLSTRPIDAVFITGSPYYPMLLASEIRRRYGVPVVLDFQDPWVSPWSTAQPRLSKIGLSHALAAVLEPRVLRAANFITSVSEIQNAQMAERYSWIDRRCMAAIPIGYDPEDFDAIGGHSSEQTTVTLNKSCINLSYVGTFWPAARRVTEALIGALARLKNLQPELTDRLRLHFIGTSNRPDGFEQFHIRPMAQSAGVADLVEEVPQRIPYLEALDVMRRSDGLLMIGSDEPHYTASKIYPSLMSGRPYLSIYHRASSAHEILSAAGGGVALAFSNAEELYALQDKICKALKQLAESPASIGIADSSVYADYEATRIAQRFADIFDGLDRARGHT